MLFPVRALSSWDNVALSSDNMESSIDDVSLPLDKALLSLDKELLSLDVKALLSRRIAGQIEKVKRGARRYAYKIAF